MKKLKLTLVLCIFLSMNSYAQIPMLDVPADVDTPQWYKEVDWATVNVYELLASFEEPGSPAENLNSLRSDHKEETEENEKDFREEPLSFERALIFWLEQNEHYVDQDGHIKIDIEAHKKKVNQTIQKAAQKQNSVNKTMSAPNGDWSILGPVENYSYGIPNQNSTNVYEIAISESNPNILYCGTENGVFFRSNNKGLSWFTVGDNVPAGSPSAMAIHPTNPDEVYWAQTGYLMYRSLNGGITWTLLSNWPNTRANKMFVLSNNRLVVAAHDGHVYYSDNKGNTWTMSSGVNSTAKISDIAVKPGNSNVIYATSEVPNTNSLKVYKSTNAGSSFASIPVPATYTAVNSRIAVTPANPNAVYILGQGKGHYTSANFVPNMLYYSGNSGDSYSIRCQFDNQGYSSNKGMVNGQGYYDMDIGVSHTDTNQIIVATTTAWKSNNGGLTWSPIGGYYGSHNSKIHADIQSIRSHGNDTYITTDGGITHSSDFYTDLTNTSLRNYNLTASWYWGFDQGWHNDLIVGGRYHMDNSSMYDGYGTPQVSISIGGGESPAGDVVELIDDPKLQGVFSNKGWIYVPDIIDSNLSYTYTNYHTSLYPSKYTYGRVKAGFTQHPYYDQTIYLGNHKGFYRSQDMGLTYEELDTFPTNVLSFDIARTNPDIILLTTYTSGIYRSTDGGETFTQLSLPSGVSYKGPNIDIKIDPENENIIWFAQASGNIGQKIFKSTNQGTTWINMGDGGIVDSSRCKFLNIQGGSNGGVYVTTMDGFTYYRDNTMNSWKDFNNNMPINFYCRNGAQIFYSKNKLRLSGNRGIMESDLYEDSEPVALPITQRKRIHCARDTVLFSDMSIAKYDGLSYQWSFPGAVWVSSLTHPKPRVVYGPGAHSVTLQISDVNGKSSTRTIDSMVIVENNCSPDTLAGKMLNVTGNGTYLRTDIGKANINSNTFSISLWVKPNGLQKSFSQLISTGPCPGSSTYGFGLGFKFGNYAKNLELCYTDSIVNYSNTSGMVLDSNKWSNVVVTYSPSGVKLYVNGWPATLRNGTMPVLDFTQNSFYVNKDIHHQGGDFSGWIDEIKFYDYTLSQSEVREKMHLISRDVASDTGLVKYIQFNNYDPTSNRCSDVATAEAITIAGGSGNILSSSAPVATGTVSRLSVLSYGKNTFPNTSTAIWWASNTTNPQGEMVGFELYSNPDQMPTGLYSAHPNKYYIVNNYGNNQIVSPPHYFLITDMSIDPNTFVMSNFQLFKRDLGDFGATWGSALSTPFAANPNLTTGYLKFPGTGITSFSQFFISTAASGSLNLEKEHTVKCTNSESEVTLYWEIERPDLYITIEILRSNASQDWEIIESLEVQQGKINYEYSDPQSAAVMDPIKYYRVRTKDASGNYHYLKPNIYCVPQKAIINLWPNPADKEIHLSLGAAREGNTTLQVLDLQGRVLAEYEMPAGQIMYGFDVSQLPSAAYYLRVSAEKNGNTTLHKFIVGDRN